MPLPVKGKPIPLGHRCTCCVERWRQREDVCNACYRERHRDQLSREAFERRQASLKPDDERAERRKAALMDSLLQQALDVAVETRRSVVVDHVEYWIVWDGSMDGPDGRRGN